jgi:hypothetical protein
MIMIDESEAKTRASILETHKKYLLLSSKHRLFLFSSKSCFSFIALHKGITT